MRSPCLTAAICAGFLLLCGAPARAQGHAAELGLLFWKPTPTLTLSTTAISGAGIEPVDFVQEFGIENKSFREFRAALGRGHKFRFAYVKFTYDAEATIQRTFTFQGRTFTIGAPATADIAWDLWTLGYEWDFVSREQGFVGLIADLRINKVVATVDSPVLRSPAGTDTRAPVPTIGIIGRGYLSQTVSVTGEFSGLKITRDEFEVRFFDFDVYGTIGSRNVGAQIGYRSVTADYLVDNDLGDLKMQGPYIGAFVRF